MSFAPWVQDVLKDINAIPAGSASASMRKAYSKAVRHYPDNGMPAPQVRYNQEFGLIILTFPTDQEEVFAVCNGRLVSYSDLPFQMQFVICMVKWIVSKASDDGSDT